jgi:hypothetical protein
MDIGRVEGTAISLLGVVTKPDPLKALAGLGYEQRAREAHIQSHFGRCERRPCQGGRASTLRP